MTEEQAQEVPEVKKVIDNPAAWLHEWSGQIGAELKDGLRRIAFARENTTVYHTYTVMAPHPSAAVGNSRYPAPALVEAPALPIAGARNAIAVEALKVDWSRWSRLSVARSPSGSRPACGCRPTSCSSGRTHADHVSSGSRIE